MNCEFLWQMFYLRSCVKPQKSFLSLSRCEILKHLSPFCYFLMDFVMSPTLFNSQTPCYEDFSTIYNTQQNWTANTKWWKMSTEPTREWVCGLHAGRKHPALSALQTITALNVRAKQNSNSSNTSLMVHGGASVVTCLEGVKPRPVRRMHLRGVGPRTHVWEDHNPFDGQTIQKGSAVVVWFRQTWFALHRNSATTRGEEADQPLTRRSSPGIRRWSVPENCATPRGRKPR